MNDFIPNEYRNKPFLTALDIQTMLCIGENKTYEFLRNDPPFRVFRIGNQLRVPAVSFWQWYLEGESN